MLRTLTAWLSPARDKHDQRRHSEHRASRLPWDSPPAKGATPSSAYCPRVHVTLRRLSFDDAHKNEVPAAAEPAAVRTVRSAEPMEEELEEAMAEFAELALPAVPLAEMSMETSSSWGAKMPQAGAAQQWQGSSGRGKQVLPPPPKCWCRLAADAKLAHMKDTDPLNPGRAYWTCANIGCSCNFFQWVEIAAPQPAVQPSSSPSHSIRRRASSLSSACVDERGAHDESEEALATSARTLSDSHLAVFGAGSKPYRSSAPIPIPMPSGRSAVNGRRRTPAKSAEDGTEASGC